MKIRIKGDAVRFRLTKSDIVGLNKTGILKEQTNFAGGTLVYAIETSDFISICAEYLNNTITLFIPRQMLSELTNTERVGFEDKSGPVHLLIEKDFTCLDNVAEDQSDNYPNPLANKLYEQKN